MLEPKTLEQWMTENGYDDDSLADKLRVHRSTVSRMRRGKQRPSFGLLDALAKLTGNQVTFESFRAGAPSPRKTAARRRKRAA